MQAELWTIFHIIRIQNVSVKSKTTFRNVNLQNDIHEFKNLALR